METSNDRLSGEKQRAKLVNLGLLLAVVFLCLIVLEIALAVFWPHKITAKPFYHIQSFFCEYHPRLGWVNKPNYQGVVNVTQDVRFTVTHNSRGQRGREHEYQKKPGTRRILVLGDSFAWGFGVEDDQVFTRILESEGPGIEVINMAVSGYGTDQELIAYLEEGYKYNPDLVILVFYSNDINEIASTIAYGYPKPMFEPGSEPLRVVNVPVPKTDETERKLYGNPSSAFGKLKRYLRRNTHTYPFIVGRLNSVPFLRNIFLKVGLASEYEHTLQGIPLFRLTEGREVWHLFFRLIRELRERASEKGTEFLLVNVPVKESDPGNALGYTGLLENAAQSNDATSRGLTKVTSENSIPFLNLLNPVRQRHAEGIRLYSPLEKDIHLNAEGHRFLARSIGQWLYTKGWPIGSPREE